MAPIKFEDDFKKKLDNRSIAPSNMVWDKLSKRLDAEQKTTNTKGFWWIGIAASVIGVLFTVVQFYNTPAETNIPVIADTPENIEQLENTTATSQQNYNVVEDKTLVAPENLDKANDTHLTKTNPQNSSLNLEETPTKVASQHSVPQKRIEQDVYQPKKIDALVFEKEKAQEVADAIFTLSETTSGVTDAAIDSLLKAAQHDILLSRMQHENKAIVDAALLLQEVEFELDESFRNKVFKALKASYGSVKTAIAQRND
ncbi:hypothetical protein ACKGJY_04595 [Hyunsoonleella sp. 2307UL5-6]|uniref:hypothetical protein n=1 Tax=Hyunsoonleella sp. 2307UL5-6 TaxID=3384768 RepID=UPI0039BC9E9D